MEPTNENTTEPKAVATGDLLEGSMMRVIGFNGLLMWIDSKRIMSVQPNNDGTSRLNMSCERESEEWNVRTPPSVIIKLLAVLHSSNAEGETRRPSAPHSH